MTLENEGRAGTCRVKLVDVTDSLAEERNHSFAVITQSFSHRERQREGSEKNQPDGDMSAGFSSWFLPV